MAHTDKNIIFFDDWCHLCSFWVKTILFFDKNRIFHFAALKGPVAYHLLPPEMKRVDTVILWRRGTIFNGMEAVIKICELLGFPLSLLKIIKLFPSSTQHRLYRIIADNRFRIFRRRKSCMRPAKKDEDSFLLHYLEK